MALEILKQYLDANDVPYVVVSHSPAYTALGVAGAAHVSGRELAKTVMVRLDGVLAMAVLPARYQVDLGLLRRAAHAKSVQLASEEEFTEVFPACETGAMPPFGNLFRLAVFADATLERDKEIAFNAGTHRELIRMAWEDFKRLATPTIADFAVGRSAEAA